MWLTRPEVAKRLRISRQTLAQWGSQGRGPKYAKFGRQVRYRVEDVEAYEAQAFSST